MTTILQPRVSLALASAEQDVQNTPQKVLLVGQITIAGSAADGSLTENVASTGDPEDALFGENSQLASMVRHFKSVNSIVQVDCLAVDDAGGGTAREVTVTFIGTATEAGTLTIVVGSEVDHAIDVAVASADDETAIALAAKTAINLDTEAPFTADSSSGVLTLTAVNAGTVANTLGVEAIGEVAGVTGQAVAESVPGATDPTLTDILDVATSRYQGIVWPWSENSQTQPVEDYLNVRFNAENAILDGVAFTPVVDSHANVLTLLDGLNSHDLVIFADKLESETDYAGPAQNEAGYNKCALFVGIRALRLTSDASISRFLVSSASKDQFGGPALASLPYFNTVMSELPGISAGRGWTDGEVEQLTDAGGSVMGINPAGDSGLSGEVVTTYLTDGAGNPDVTFTFLNYVDTSSNIREYFFNNYKARFAQSRLTEGNLSRGRDVANELSIRAFSEQLYQDLSNDEFVLVQSGEAAFDFYKQNLDVELDLSEGKVTITMFVAIVTQLRTIIGTIKIAFSTS